MCVYERLFRCVCFWMGFTFTHGNTFTNIIIFACKVLISASMQRNFIFKQLPFMKSNKVHTFLKLIWNISIARPKNISLASVYASFSRNPVRNARRLRHFDLGLYLIQTNQTYNYSNSTDEKNSKMFYYNATLLLLVYKN